jgi:hypothetical protein
VDEAAFGNNSGRVVRFGPLPKFVVPVRSVNYSGKREVVAFRHFKSPVGKINFYHRGH